MSKFEEFVSDEVNREHLRKEMPFFLKALEAVKEQLEAGRINEGIVNPNIGNAYFQQLAGANHLINGLKELTKPKPQIKPPTARRQFTEADREALKELQAEQRRTNA